MFSLLPTGQSFAKDATYRVASQDGEFFVWNGLDVGWEPVSKSIVYKENTIFQSMGKSRIDLRQTKETVQGTAKNIFVESDGRIIFRLNDEVVRKLQISNNFVSKLDTGLKKEEEKEEKLDIMSAWKKVASLMKPSSQEKGGDSAKVGAGEAAKQTSSVADTSERIEFTYPARGGIFVPDSLPMTVPIIWKAVTDEKGCYEVFVKSVDRAGFNSVGVVKEPRIDFKLKKPGAYVVRIQCTGNSARSEELTFNVLPSESKEWKIPVAQPKKPITTKKTAELKKSADPKSKTGEEKPLAPDLKKLPVSEKKDAEN
jgi:hypothetical protein